MPGNTPGAPTFTEIVSSSVSGAAMRRAIKQGKTADSTPQIKIRTRLFHFARNADG